PKPDGSAVISGHAVTVPKGSESGGASTDATFTVSANHKHFELTSSSDSAFALPVRYDKLYEPKEDTTPPTSTVAMAPASSQSRRNVPPIGTSSVPFTIKASDGGGQGVVALWYRSYGQGARPPPYTPIVLDQPVANAQASFDVTRPNVAAVPYVVQAYAADASGNDEAPHTLTFGATTRR